MSWLKRPDTLDEVLLFVLGLVALLGFHSTFSGWEFLIAGAIGLALGMALALISARLEQPIVVLAVFVIAAFFVLGGVIALHGVGSTWFLPVPHTLSALLDNSVHGWKKLVTTLPPVDGGPLITLPYLLGLVTGAAGATVMRRSRSAWLPGLAPTVLLAVVILLGVKHPGQVGLISALFVILLVVWISVRGQRSRQLRQGGSQTARLVTATGLCLAAALVAMFAGPHLPGLKNDRLILRSHIQPPLNVGKYPSPLSSFRRYTAGYVPPVGSSVSALKNAELFTVKGLKPGTPIRIATLDNYTGESWAASKNAGLGSGGTDEYSKVGQVIANPTTGPETSGVTFTIKPAYVDHGVTTNVWVPTVGGLTSIRFQKPDAETGGSDLRYNLDAGSAVMPGALSSGDTYTVSAVNVDEKEVTPSTTMWQSGPTYAASADARFHSLVDAWKGSSSNPTDQIYAIGKQLLGGAYSDGKDHGDILAGHSLYRLGVFSDVAHGLMVGDEEQYDAFMAILANLDGVPARVVFGATVPDDHRDTHVITGLDVHPWVELRVADGSWEKFDPKNYVSHDPNIKKQDPTQQPLSPSNPIPPPAPVRPPTTTGDPLDEGRIQAAHSTTHHSVIQLPDWLWGVLKYVGRPILLVLLLGLAIVGFKYGRRRLRRTRGEPKRRLAAAWFEVLDHARDHGIKVPVGTRREQATELGVQGVEEAHVLAWDADTQMFGATGPNDESVADFWSRVDEYRKTVNKARGFRARVLATLNLATVRPGRFRRA